jgi:hypothetical protein
VEEILIVVLQAVGELFLQVIIYLPFEWPRSWRGRGEAAGCGWGLLYLLFGAGIGWVSVLIFPHVFLPYPWLRVANLAAAPLACGWTSYLFARWRQSRGQQADPPAHFFSGAMFALAFVIVRFILAKKD